MAEAVVPVMGYQGPVFWVELNCLRARELEGWVVCFWKKGRKERKEVRRGVERARATTSYWLAASWGFSILDTLPISKKFTSASASGLAAEDEESIETKTKAAKAAEKRSFEEEEEERRAICFFLFFLEGEEARRGVSFGVDMGPRVKSREASDAPLFVLYCN